MIYAWFSSNESVRLDRYLSLSPRFSEVVRCLCSRHRCVCGAASITSLKRGNIDHSDAADSFCAGCLIGVDRVAAARRAAFLRRKYVTRRLRLIRARSCCPMALYGLKIAETQSALQPIVLFLRTISR